MIKNILRIAALIIVVLVSDRVSAQLSSGGIPPGFLEPKSLRQIGQQAFMPPNYELLKQQDDSVSSMGVPERMGVCIKTDISMDNSGSWTDINDDIRIWQHNLRIEDAIGLGLYYTDFHLAKGDKLFIYSEDKTHLLGAFTDQNNKDHGLFATEPVKGESIIIELVDDKRNSVNSRFVISEVLVVYKPMQFCTINQTSNESSRNINSTKGDSDPCEVSSVCQEGDSWRDQINGVVRIMVKNGASAYWCTGSVMNNTSLDFSPLILTADHCALSNGRYASTWDLALWIFFFKHEAKTCADDTPTGTRSLTGATKLASSTPNGNDGSDFYLVELFEDIPNSYEPYFQGWSAMDELSNNGVSIHHPAGDVKKISTYTTPLEYSQWGNTPQTHLMVQWSQTANGHGVTEGGSSGSPLFNSAGRILGQLTGGESDCTNLTGMDHYGRVYYSWDKNGNNDTLKLQPWLDPLNTGLTALDGSYNTKVAVAQFVANETTIPVGSYVRFTDLSINNPTTWNWTFESGDPQSSSLQQPGLVYFDKLGSYDVTLVVSNEFGQDSILLENYIRVVPVIYPNPTSNNVFILFGNDKSAHDITITDAMGKTIKQFTVAENNTRFEFSFLTYPAGLYLISVKSTEKEEQFKVLFTP